MEKNPVLDFNKLCNIIAEINKTFKSNKRRDDTINDRVQEYLILKSIERPELETEYLHICKVMWEGATLFNTDCDPLIAFTEIMDTLERAYCVTEEELKSFKKSVLAEPLGKMIKMEITTYYVEYKIMSEGNALIEVMEGEEVADVLEIYLADNGMNLGEGEVSIIKTEKA